MIRGRKVNQVYKLRVFLRFYWLAESIPSYQIEEFRTFSGEYNNAVNILIDFLHTWSEQHTRDYLRFRTD